jgi:MFS family permease
VRHYEPLENRFGWKPADTSMVFTIAVIVLALSFVVAGRIQDKVGPLACSLVGWILVSLGFFLCSYTFPWPNLRFWRYRRQVSVSPMLSRQAGDWRVVLPNCNDSVFVLH